MLKSHLDRKLVFFKEFFCNISQRLGFDPNDVVNYDNNNYLDMYNYINDTFDLLSDPPNIEEILHYADDIEWSKNSCVDGIKYVICKNLLTSVNEYFLDIFSSSIISGIFPKVWSRGNSDP